MASASHRETRSRDMGFIFAAILMLPHQRQRSASNVQPHRRALSGWVSGQSMAHPFCQLSGSCDPSPASIAANQRMVQLATIALVLVHSTSFVHD